MPENIPDAIEQARLDVEAVAAHAKPPVKCESGPRVGKWDWDAYNELHDAAREAEVRLARLGPPSVALAEALNEIAEWAEEYPYDSIGGVEVASARRALTAWAETQHSDADGA